MTHNYRESTPKSSPAVEFVRYSAAPFALITDSRDLAFAALEIPGGADVLVLKRPAKWFESLTAEMAAWSSLHEVFADYRGVLLAIKDPALKRFCAGTTCRYGAPVASLDKLKIVAWAGHNGFPLASLAGMAVPWNTTFPGYEYRRWAKSLEGARR